jgi:hypothetical protein
LNSPRASTSSRSRNGAFAPALELSRSVPLVPYLPWRWLQPRPRAADEKRRSVNHQWRHQHEVASAKAIA